MTPAQDATALADKPLGWVVKNSFGAIELFLGHERALDAFNGWGSFIGPVFEPRATSQTPDAVAWLKGSDGPKHIQEFAAYCEIDDTRNDYIEYCGTTTDGRPYVLCLENWHGKKYDRYFILPHVDSTPSASAGPQAEAVWIELLRAAKQMPRATPAPGASCTEHPFTIEAAKVWDLDRAIKAVEAHPQPQQADGRRAVSYEAAGQCIWESQQLRLRDQTSNAAKRPWRSKDVPDFFWDSFVLDARAALQQSPATDNASAVDEQRNHQLDAERIPSANKESF